MKKLSVLFTALVFVLPLAAQNDALNSMSLNGATGIYVVPTARVGFSDADIGFNAGYHTNFFKPLNGDWDMNHLLKANLSLFKMVELSGTFDVQPEPPDDNNDLIIGVKFQLPFGSVPIAFGFNYQRLNLGRENSRHWAFQVYGAITYHADLFSWPSETTLVIGHTFSEDDSNSNIDFGMGFDLILLPKYFGNFVHFLIDFANFSYSYNPWGADAWGRGVFNTGLRFDLGRIKALNKFNFAVDIFLADAFDSRDFGSGRSFGTGITFGMKF